MSRTADALDALYSASVNDPYTRLALRQVASALATVRGEEMIKPGAPYRQAEMRHDARVWLERCLPAYLDALTPDDVTYGYFMEKAQSEIERYERGESPKVNEHRA